MAKSIIILILLVFSSAAADVTKYSLDPTTGSVLANAPAHRCHFMVVPLPLFVTMVSDQPGYNTVLAENGSVNWYIQNLTFNYSTVGIFAMPGEKITLQIQDTDDEPFRARGVNDSLIQNAFNTWEWTSPNEPGHTELVFVSKDSARKTIVHAFTKIPAGQLENGRLGQFRFGTYPPEAEVSKKAHYTNPDGFIEVNEHTKDLQLSPHFRLGEFVSKQAGGLPKYVYLKESLILKLEMIRQAMINAGHEVKSMHVMSGYRTPFYNKTIGNVPFSRHVYGDAADIYVDNDRNGRMDDLNNDRVVDMKDARVMQSVVEKLKEDPLYAPLIGGLGTYGPAPHRGPFIHVDTRGYVARWTSE